MARCKGRLAYQSQMAECGDKRTHPAHLFQPPILSPFVRRALAGELPAKVTR